MRDWQKFEDDEIMTIWKGYLAHDMGYDPLRLNYVHPNPIRLTPVEIIKLVDDLMRRLKIKETHPCDKENEGEA